VTEAGRARSKFNALKHGVFALTPVLPNEDGNELRRRTVGVHLSLNPQNEPERILADQVVQSSWLHDRAVRAQTARLSKQINDREFHEQERIYSLWNILFHDARGHTNLYGIGPWNGCGPRTSWSGEPDPQDCPARLIRHLHRSSFGCKLLLSRWLELRHLAATHVWQAPHKLWAIRMLGCQPLDAITRRDIAIIILRSWTINRQRENAWRELRSETRREEYIRFCQRVRSQWGLLNSHDKDQERQSLLEVLDRAIAEVEEKLALAEAREAREAAIEADCLAFDGSEEGERLRRYELAAHRKCVRSIDSFMKVRNASVDGLIDAAQAAEPGGSWDGEDPAGDPGATTEFGGYVDESEADRERSRGSRDMDREGNPEVQPAGEPYLPIDAWEAERWSSGDAEELDRVSEPVFSDPTRGGARIGGDDPITAIDPFVTDAALATTEKSSHDPAIADLDWNATIDPIGTLDPLTTIENTGTAASPIRAEILPSVGDENSRNDPRSWYKAEPNGAAALVSATDANSGAPIVRGTIGASGEDPCQPEQPRWPDAVRSVLISIVLFATCWSTAHLAAAPSSWRSVLDSRPTSGRQSVTRLPASSSSVPGLTRLPCDECILPGHEAQGSVSGEDAHSKAGFAEHGRKVLLLEEALPVDLLVPAIEVADPAERGDPPGQNFVAAVFLGYDEDRPVIAFCEQAARARPGHSTGAGHIEQQQTSRREGIVDPPEELPERAQAVIFVEEVIEALADGCHRHAGRELRAQERFHAKLSTRNAAARQGNHSVRDIDPQDVVPRLGDGFREDPATAPQIDDQPGSDAVTLQGREQESGGFPCDRPEARVVDIRQVVPVGGLARRALHFFSSFQRNVYASAIMNADCLLSAAPPWPPSIFS
jgi:hypothetical protein